MKTEKLLQRDGAADIKFSGRVLAKASSQEDKGRWTELALYRTEGVKYVCHSIGRTMWAGEHDRHAADVCETTDGVIEFFGHGWLAKEIYFQAGIDATVRVD